MLKSCRDLSSITFDSMHLCRTGARIVKLQWIMVDVFIHFQQSATHEHTSWSAGNVQKRKLIIGVCNCKFASQQHNCTFLCSWSRITFPNMRFQMKILLEIYVERHNSTQTNLPKALTVEPGFAREPWGEPAGVLVLVGTGDLIRTYWSSFETERPVIRAFCRLQFHNGGSLEFLGRHHRQFRQQLHITNKQSSLHLLTRHVPILPALRPFCPQTTKFCPRCTILTWCDPYLILKAHSLILHTGRSVVAIRQQADRWPYSTTHRFSSMLSRVFIGQSAPPLKSQNCIFGHEKQIRESNKRAFPLELWKIIRYRATETCCGFVYYWLNPARGGGGVHPV